jgi:hypothetical protein
LKTVELFPLELALEDVLGRIPKLFSSPGARAWPDKCCVLHALLVQLDGLPCCTPGWGRGGGFWGVRDQVSPGYRCGYNPPTTPAGLLLAG